MQLVEYHQSRLYSFCSMSTEPLTPLKPLRSLRLLQEVVDLKSKLSGLVTPGECPGARHFQSDGHLSVESSRHGSSDSLCRMQPQFARMRPQVLAYFQLHPVKLS